MRQLESDRRERAAVVREACRAAGPPVIDFIPMAKKTPAQLDREIATHLHRYGLPNGRAKGRRPSEFDLVQLRRGIQVEMEHTSDPKIAERIAMDHLVEDPLYYVKLAKIHVD